MMKPGNNIFACACSANVIINHNSVNITGIGLWLGGVVRVISKSYSDCDILQSQITLFPTLFLMFDQNDYKVQFLTEDNLGLKIWHEKLWTKCISPRDSRP